MVQVMPQADSGSSVTTFDTHDLARDLVCSKNFPPKSCLCIIPGMPSQERREDGQSLHGVRHRGDPLPHFTFIETTTAEQARPSVNSPAYLHGSQCVDTHWLLLSTRSGSGLRAQALHTVQKAGTGIQFSTLFLLSPPFFPRKRTLVASQ